MTSVAQTIVCATPRTVQQKQGARPRAKLLPKADKKRQVSTTKNAMLGYARVSKTEGQDIASQIEALEAAGCQRIYEEKASGARWNRPELTHLIGKLNKGDVLVVWKLDRLSRSLKDMLLILERIQAAGAGFKSLTEAIDTTAPAGRMMMQMLGSFAEYEREMVRERTRAGLQAARAQGRHGGRKPKFSADQKAEILTMLAAGRSAADVARLFRVHRHYQPKTAMWPVCLQSSL
jgi:DNA invertase Pin-like site-specific DNA recombinase